MGPSLLGTFLSFHSFTITNINDLEKELTPLPQYRHSRQITAVTLAVSTGNAKTREREAGVAEEEVVPTAREPASSMADERQGMGARERLVASLSSRALLMYPRYSLSLSLLFFFFFNFCYF